MFLIVFTVVWLATIGLLHSLGLDLLAMIALALFAVSWASQVTEGL